jgi:hypothetical protein
MTFFSEYQINVRFSSHFVTRMEESEQGFVDAYSSYYSVIEKAGRKDNEEYQLPFPFSLGTQHKPRILILFTFLIHSQPLLSVHVHQKAS